MHASHRPVIVRPKDGCRNAAVYPCQRLFVSYYNEREDQVREQILGIVILPIFTSSTSGLPHGQIEPSTDELRAASTTPGEANKTLAAYDLGYMPFLTNANSLRYICCTDICNIGWRKSLFFSRNIYGICTS